MHYYYKCDVRYSWSFPSLELRKEVIIRTHARLSILAHIGLLIAVKSGTGIQLENHIERMARPTGLSRLPRLSSVRMALESRADKVCPSPPPRTTRAQKCRTTRHADYRIVLSGRQQAGFSRVLLREHRNRWDIEPCQR